ncbi:sigma 54-interacting response regulator [Mucilaginibacter aquaedulcis]|uniref:sigma 54-interacting response regulator n=1 Tax=Mucilaginibacter aquaedulcis TaxID=1187081 RepID=UPI0025B5BFAC|nr:sigma 54-interacting response regulator [Mucilaginibacter aquaedulcis]MDN3548876.1 sigma 54-interacting response regulator [Mucilaginibacter aquaedulcis]
MNGKILIVEDEFIVASDLRIILEKAGHQICGIAPSVARALDIIKLKRPEMVFIDIQLSGNLTGIDLARQLQVMQIPFIYVSANSNQRILEEAKLTRPYGFLVKPFREKDVLVTLDIAAYRHENNLEAKLIKENILQQKIADIMIGKADWQEKIRLILEALNEHIPIDYHSTCWVNNGEEFDDGILFFKENNAFELISMGELAAKTGRTDQELKEAIIPPEALNKAAWFAGEQFEQMCAQNPFRKIISRAFDLGSALIMPVFIPGKGIFTYSFYSHGANSYNQEHSALLDRLGLVLMRIAAIIPKAGQHNGFLNAEREILAHDIIGADDSQDEIHGLVGSSPTFQEIKKQLAVAAPFEISVLILGESGTGKERIAQAIHRLSNRKAMPFVKVNCAAIPATLMESELFGHEKGAFTGALNRRIGKFEQAASGTIFLDEIGELPLDLQVKLLCVLQEKEIVRLGGNQIIKTDVRIIAATNRNLEREVAEGRFRLDLYYRLNVFPMMLPPLRERTEDIAQLAEFFLRKYSKQMTKNIRYMSSDVLQALTAYDWPGNIREMENIMERAVLLNTGDTLDVIDLPDNTLPQHEFQSSDGTIKTIRELEKDHILNVLKKCNGRIGGNGGAAELLDVAPTTLISKMNKLGIVKKFKT